METAGIPAESTATLQNEKKKCLVTTTQKERLTNLVFITAEKKGKGSSSHIPEHAALLPQDTQHVYVRVRRVRRSVECEEEDEGNMKTSHKNLLDIIHLVLFLCLC